MNIFTDERIVMTLDAGGTNFVFSAIRAGKELVEPLTFPSNGHDLDLCLKTLISGFETVKRNLPEAPVAISFSFPGPANYKAGIIGNLPNFPAFNADGVALGPMLEDYFQLPVFIANDGDLFAYGESIAGILLHVNTELRRKGKVDKQYNNLLGITLGTGLGGGIVVNGQLCQGDNSAGGEIWLSRNFQNTDIIAEDGASIKAIQWSYARQTGGKPQDLTPADIYAIATGSREGDQRAAQQAFDDMAYVVAETLCNAITLIDGIIVIGGGISGAYSLIAPKIVDYMNGTIQNMHGHKLSRLVSRVYDLEDPASFDDFLAYEAKGIKVPFSNRVVFDSLDKKIAIGKSRLGTNRAISLGAYAMALHQLSSSAQQPEISVL